MAKKQQCCGTCVWWAFSPSMKGKDGRWKPDVCASCKYPESRFPVAFQRGIHPSRWMGRKEGVGCCCYEEAQVASVATNPVEQS